MHSFETYTITWQRTTDRRDRLNREAGWRPGWRTRLRHPVVASDAE